MSFVCIDDASAPTQGDNTTIKACSGTPHNVIHQWEGKFRAMNIQKNANNYTVGTLELDDDTQIF
jgi:hypothetical protein